LVEGKFIEIIYKISFFVANISKTMTTVDCLVKYLIDQKIRWAEKKYFICRAVDKLNIFFCFAKWAIAVT
jgi:hypothetical protein